MSYNPSGGYYADPNNQAAYGGYDGGGGGGGDGYDMGGFQASAPTGHYGGTTDTYYGNNSAEGYYPTSPQGQYEQQPQHYDPTSIQDMYDPSATAAGGSGTYFQTGQFQPHLQQGPISAVAFDPVTSALYTASHTVSLGRRPSHVGGGVTHGAYVSVHNISDGSLFSANSAHPEAKATVLEAISSAIYGSRANVGSVDQGGGIITSTARRPPPHAYRPPYSSMIDDSFESSFSVRSSHGMGIGSILPFSSGDVLSDTSYAATVSPSSVRVQTNGCACISAARTVQGMVCGSFNPIPSSYGGTSAPTHITVGGAAADSSLTGSGARYNMHCMDLYADLRVVSSHALVADSEIAHCVTCIRPNNTMSTLAAGCSDGTVRVFDGRWRKRGNKEVAKVKGHGGGVVSIDVSEDGNLIVTTGYSARSSFSSTGGTQVPYAFPDQHVLIYDVRYLGRGGIAHSFTGERGGPRYAAFIPGDEKNRILVASGQSGGGCQICTPYDDLEGTGLAEYIQPELVQGEKITALSIHGRDMAIGTSQSSIILFKMSDASPTIPSASELPNADERATLIPPDYVSPQPEVSIEPNVLRVGAEDSTAMFANAYMLSAKPVVSSLKASGHLTSFGPLSSNPLVEQSRRSLSDKLLDLMKTQNTNDFVVSLKTSDLDMDLLAAENQVKKRISRTESTDINSPNPNRLVFSNSTSTVCYKVPVNTRKRGAKGTDDTKEANDSIPLRYRLTIRPLGSIMSPSEYIKNNNTGLWPGWDYPPSMPNAWASPVLMLLYFVPEIRTAVLSAQKDERLFAPTIATTGKNRKLAELGPAVSAELAYIFHQIEMLSSHALLHPKVDALDEPQVRAFSPANLITLLSALPEANQLQILDGAAVSIQTARKPEALYRFLIHHLDSELTSQEPPSSGRRSPTVKLIDSKQGLNYQSINEFVDVSTTPTISSTRTLTVELAYEPFVGKNKKQEAVESSKSIRFSDVLRYSLCKEARLRAWCKATNDYETVVQRKIATSLPSILSIACSCAGEKNSDGAAVWKSSDNQSRHWLPEFIEVEIEDDGNVIVRELIDTDREENGTEWSESKGSALPKEVVNILRKSERWTTPSGERKIRYQLEAVVSYIRSTSDADTDKGHHILHVRVPKAYDETAILKQIEELDIYAEESADSDLMTLSANVSGEIFQERLTRAAEKLKGLAEEEDGDSWLLVNGLVSNKTVVDDARAFHVDFKEPNLVTYRQVEENESDVEDEKYRLESSQFDIPLSLMNAPSISTGLPPAFFVQDASDLPGKGDLIAFDAEFVSVQHEDYVLTAAGSKVFMREGRNALARMSVLDCKTGTVIIDDHIMQREPVVDYLTRFSGILEEHLDPEKSSHHLITARNAYLKLRFLLERGCIFVGHGLSQDFATANIFVPPSQIIDTVEIFHLTRMRYISLRFLVNYLLKRDMQQDIHDSIEDARAAFDLYLKAVEYKKSGEFDKVLREIYDFGRKTEWKLGVGE